MAATNQGSERKTDRLEAFSDAVLAIAITLPVAELKAPETKLGGDLGADFGGLGSHYAAYGLSWAVLGIFPLQREDHQKNRSRLQRADVALPRGS